MMLKIGERYDPASNTWTPIDDLLEPREDHALAFPGRSLSAVGGTRSARVGPATTSFPALQCDATASACVPLAQGLVKMRACAQKSRWAAL
jgi:hypothetical protein